MHYIYFVYYVNIYIHPIYEVVGASGHHATGPEFGSGLGYIHIRPQFHYNHSIFMRDRVRQDSQTDRQTVKTNSKQFSSMTFIVKIVQLKGK